MRRLASTQGTSWDTWKVSHLDGPNWVDVSTQLVNQPPPSPSKPASGMTVISSSGAVVFSASPNVTQSDARPLVPWNRYSTGKRAVLFCA